jgi:hypothetical protein
MSEISFMDVNRLITMITSICVEVVSVCHLHESNKRTSDTVGMPEETIGTLHGPERKGKVKATKAQAPKAEAKEDCGKVGVHVLFIMCCSDGHIVKHYRTVHKCSLKFNWQ